MTNTWPFGTWKALLGLGAGVVLRFQAVLVVVLGWFWDQEPWER